MRLMRFRDTVWVAVLSILVCRPAVAQINDDVYEVQVNIGVLDLQRTYALELQLVDGALVGDGNAQAFVTHLQLTGGTFISPPLPNIGNIQASAASGLSFLDGPATSGPVADYAQQFTVGGSSGSLTFDLQLASSSVDVPIPDNFSVYVLDPTFEPLPTDGPTLTELLSADYSTTSPAPEGFSTLDSPRLRAHITHATLGLWSMTLDPPMTCATLAATGSVDLNGQPLASTGKTIALTSSNRRIATVPATVTVGQYSTMAQFPVSTRPVATETHVTITANDGKKSVHTDFVVEPLLTGFSVDSNMVCGGLSTQGTVTIGCPAPAGGSRLELSNSDTADVAVPRSVVVPAGLTSVTFPIRTHQVKSDTTVKIIATDGGVVESQTIDVMSPNLAALSITPVEFLAGSNAAGTLTLNCKALPTGALVNVSSSLPSVVQAPPEVTILGEATTAHFQITSNQVAVPTSVTVTAVYRAVTLQQTLIVLPAYGITDLGGIDGRNSQAYALSDSSQVVGVSDTGTGDTHAFAFKSGVLSDLLTLGGQNSQAFGIDSHGAVVGSSDNSLGDTHAYLWTATSGMVDLQTLGGQNSAAYGVNKSAKVVGASDDGTRDTHAFIWSAAGGMTDLLTLGGQNSVAYAINDTGLVVGASDDGLGDTHAFSWTSSGGMVDLGTLGGQNSVGYAVNATGQIAGAADTDAADTHACLWTAGTPIDLGTLCGPNSMAYGLNGIGEVVGVSDTGNGDSRPFLYYNGIMCDLSATLPKGNGWILTEARAINNKKQIVGWGTINGSTHAFLMTLK